MRENKASRMKIARDFREGDFWCEDRRGTDSKMPMEVEQDFGCNCTCLHFALVTSFFTSTLVVMDSYFNPATFSNPVGLLVSAFLPGFFSNFLAFNLFELSCLGIFWPRPFVCFWFL
jgi:hypothetical protein